MRATRGILAGACIRSGYIPAGLTELAMGYRIGVVGDLGRYGGESFGTYRGAVIVAWAVDRRRSAAPIPPNPRIKSAQEDGSGTV